MTRRLLLGQGKARSSIAAKKPRYPCIIEYFTKSLKVIQSHSKLLLLLLLLLRMNVIATL